jgi:nucleoside phosphorylase
VTDVLVVAATAPELAWVGGRARALVCGVGPVEAALAVQVALAAARPAPRAILHVGIAGARPPLAVLDLALGARSVYVDLVDPASIVPRVAELEPDAALLAAARGALPEAHVVEIATSARIGGAAAAGSPVEGMEGFGVLRAAAVHGVPAVELRAISNAIAEPDRSRWDFPGALAAVAAAGERVLAALANAPR